MRLYLLLSIIFAGWWTSFSPSSSIVRAAISCQSDMECQELYGVNDTVCLQDSGICSNPFENGCLGSEYGRKVMMDKYGQEDVIFSAGGQDFTIDNIIRRVRTCNSDDGSDSTNCLPSPLSYKEIRINQATWESSLIYAWIYQIALMELLEVPITIGIHKNFTQSGSFYNPNNVLEYASVGYPYSAMSNAAKYNGDCTRADEEDEQCIHVMPEVWPGQAKNYEAFVANQTIEPPIADGLLGRAGFRIPAKTAKEYPNLGISFGLQGEENRQFLAETFLRPLSWAQYCANVSSTGCTEPDDVAARPPVVGVEVREQGEERGTSEEKRYFQEGVYTGYFQFTNENNCTLTPNCTGHVATPPCGWSFQIDSQLFWNGFVGLARDGPEPIIGSYKTDQLTQVYRAANATNNHVLMFWYDPHPLSVRFDGTDYEMKTITMPDATVECLANPLTTAEKCSPDIEVRRGPKEADCGPDAVILDRLLSKSISKISFLGDDANESPAYDFIRHTRMGNLEIRSIISDASSRKIDFFGYDLRAAVCGWVAQNLDTLATFIPPEFPRVERERSDFRVWYIRVVQCFSGFVAVCAFVGFWAVVKHRNTKVMTFAQPIFMNLILLGFMMVAIGAVINSLVPTKASCVGTEWLLLLGYTIELVPVLVKTAKINQLVRSSKKQKRISINRRNMLIQVAVIVLFVVAFLITWTVVDPPIAQTTQSLRGTEKTVVENDLVCEPNSGSLTWELVSPGWHLTLLVLAAILAFQSRGVMRQLNESRSLAFMVYSHFFFVCLRSIFFILRVQQAFPSSVISAIFTAIYSLDAFSAMAIYVFPKLYQARKTPEVYKPGMLSITASQFPLTATEEEKEADSNLTILVCSANLGNASPSAEAMESWIPLGGCCNRIEPLDDEDMPKGTFGLIAIGMQEATWNEKPRKLEAPRGEELTEEDVFNALEEKNTAELREIVQDILGDDYCQITDEKRGQMRLHLWAKRRVAEHVTDVKISGANTGIGNVLANKGGIVATVEYRQTRLSFVTAHLAAHEGDSYYKARCDNIRSILREAKTFETSSKLDVATSSHHTFFLGDLNFRCRFDGGESPEKSVQKAMDLIEFKDYDSLFEHDELTKGLCEGDLLSGFTSLPCDFPPTFKVERQKGLKYKSQRMPSWTDRILFKSSPGLDDNLKPLAYEACLDFDTSDHKPIRGAYSMTPNKALGTVEVDYEIIFEFKEIMCSGIPAVNPSGKSDPFVKFVWDSVELHTEKVAAVDFFRWWGDYPRTSRKSKTLNPEWKGESISLGLKNSKIGSDAMLFLIVLNQDAVGTHELLGAAALNVIDLVASARKKNRARTHMAVSGSADPPDCGLEFSLDLCRDGKSSGTIKFHVDFTLKNFRGRTSMLQNFRARSMRSSLVGVGTRFRSWGEGRASVTTSTSNRGGAGPGGDASSPFKNDDGAIVFLSDSDE